MRNCAIRGIQDVTGNPTPMRKLKGHYAISGHGGSECIGVATFKFPYGDTVLEFDAPIVKDSDFPLILALRDQERLGTHGANQKENSILLVMDRRRKLSAI